MSKDARPVSLRRNAIANVAGRALSAALWLAVTPYALSRLGPERFGIWSLFFVFGGYVANLDLGVGQSTARYVAVATASHDGGMIRQVLGRSLWVGGATGVLWCALFAVFRDAFLAAFHVPPALAPEVQLSLVVLALSMFAFSVTQVLHGALQGLQRFDLANAFMLAGLAVHTTILVVGLARGGGLMAAAVAMIAGHLVSGLLAAAAVRGTLRAMPSPAVSGQVTWRDLLGFGGLVQATNAFAVGWLQAGKVLLGALGSVLWVTTFELGFRVALAVLSVAQLIQGAVIPAAARASAEPGGDVRGVYLWACRWLFSFGGLMLAGLWLAAPALITAWLGPGHRESADVARMLALAFLVLLVPGPATAVARGSGAPGIEAIAFGIAFVLDVILCLLLVPRWGPQGAAVAMGVSIGVAGAYCIRAVHRRLGVATAGWALRTAAPRVLPPIAAAVTLSALGLGGSPGARGEALVALAWQAAAFLVLAVGATWPTGDAREVVALVRRRLGGTGTVTRAAGGTT